MRNVLILAIGILSSISSNAFAGTIACKGIVASVAAGTTGSGEGKVLIRVKDSSGKTNLYSLGPAEDAATRTKLQVALTALLTKRTVSLLYYSTQEKNCNDYAWTNGSPLVPNGLEMNN